MNTEPLVCIARMLQQVANPEAGALLLAPPAVLAQFERRVAGFTGVATDPDRVPFDWVLVALLGGCPTTVQAGAGRGDVGPWSLSIGMAAIRELEALGLPVRDRLGAVRETGPHEETRALCDSLGTLTDGLAASVTMAPGGASLVCEAWLGRIVRDLAHEFNNVMGGVMGLMEVARNVAESAEADNILETAISRVHEFSRLVKTVLEMGRTTVPERAPTLPDAPALKAIELLGHRLKRKHIRSQCQATGSRLIYADQALVTLTLARIIEMLWERALDGDLIRVDITGDEKTTGTLYTLAVFATEQSKPVGRYWQDPHPRILDGPPRRVEVDLACLRYIAEMQGGTLIGPQEGQEPRMSCQLVLPCAPENSQGG